MDDRQTERRIHRALVAARATAAVVLLGSAAFTRRPIPSLLGVDALVGLALVTGALTAIQAIAAARLPRVRWIVRAQMVADAGVISSAVLLTGGLDSLLTPLYVLPVVAAAVVHHRRGGLFVAALSTVFYSCIVAVQYGAAGAPYVVWFPTLADVAKPPVRDAWLTVAFNGVGFVSVAGLTGYLSERVRHSDERLRQASTQIANLQAFSQCVVDSLTGGLATSDLDGHVLTFNRAAEQITGWRAHEAAGRRLANVLQLSDEFVGGLSRLNDSGAGCRIELPYRTQSGVILELGLTAAPLMGAASQVGYLFTFQDITEHKRHDREAQTERRLAAIGEMAAGIAHEIRNPLASMTGSIQVLSKDLALSEEQNQLMEIVLRESERLNQTIGNFLAYARPPRPSATIVDLDRTVRASAALLRNSAQCSQAHQVVVQSNGPTFARGDEAQVLQVIWNLATNGLKAMPDGGRLDLEVGPGPSGAVAVTVRDQGVGMTTSELDHMFEPFRSTFAGGTGLGLSIVHRIVRDAGGSIEVESVRGSGTAVRVLLPGGEAADVALPRALSA